MEWGDVKDFFHAHTTTYLGKFSAVLLIVALSVSIFYAKKHADSRRHFSCNTNQPNKTFIEAECFDKYGQDYVDSFPPVAFVGFYVSLIVLLMLYTLFAIRYVLKVEKNKEDLTQIRGSMENSYSLFVSYVMQIGLRVVILALLIWLQLTQRAKSVPSTYQCNLKTPVKCKDDFYKDNRMLNYVTLGLSAAIILSSALDCGYVLKKCCSKRWGERGLNNLRFTRFLLDIQEADQQAQELTAIEGVVGGQSEDDDDEEIRPELCAACQSASPLESQKVVKTKSKILKNLNKNNFDGHIDCLVRRYHQGTREKILNKIQRMVNKNDASDTHIMTILAHAGIGKSVLAAKACKIMKRKGKLAACHFLEKFNTLRNSPRMMFESLASHLCETVLGFQKELEQRLLRINDQDLQKMNCHAMFNVFLEDPLNACSPPQNGNYLIVIDALDECDPSQKKELSTTLFKMNGGLAALPKWLKVLITSRSTREDLPPMPGMVVVNIDPNDEENKSDVRKFLQSGLKDIYPDVKPEDITRITLYADGLFLFAFFVLEYARTKHIELSRVSRIFPKGISSVYQEYFSRLQNALSVDEKKFFNFLEAIAAAQGPLPEDMLLQILGFDDRSHGAGKPARALNDISVLLPVVDGHVTVFHKSVVDWLLGNSEVEDETPLAVKCTEKFHKHCFSVRAEDGHKLLANYSMRLQKTVKELEIFPPVLNDSQRYALKFGLRHMRSAGNFEVYLKYCLIDVELLTACFFTMPLEMFLKEIYIIGLRKEVKNLSVVNWLLKLEDTTALYFHNFTQVVKPFPSPIQIAVNCQLSKLVKAEALELARKPKYKDFVFLELEPYWPVPETISSDSSVSASPSGKTVIVWGTNRPKKPLKTTIAKVDISKKDASDVKIFHDSSISPRDVCISPDEKNVMLVTADGCLECRNIDNLQLERKFETKERQYASSCCFSKSGDKVIAGYSDGNIRVWDFNTASVKRTMCGEAEIICCIVSEDGKLLTGEMNNDNDGGTLRVWKSLKEPSPIVLSRQWVTKYKCVAFSPSGDRIIAVCLTRDEDGQTLQTDNFSSYNPCIIQLFNANNGEPIYSTSQLVDNVISLLACNESTFLISINYSVSCFLVLLDTKKAEIVSRAYVKEEKVYFYMRYGNTSKVTALGVREDSHKPSYLQNPCKCYFLNIKLLKSN